MSNADLSESAKLEKSLAEMWRREEFYEKAIAEDVLAEHAYKVAKAKAILESNGTSDKTREADAIIQTSSLFLEHLRAKGVREFAKTKVQDADTAVSARQTLLTNRVKSDLRYTVSEAPG